MQGEATVITECGGGGGGGGTRPSHTNIENLFFSFYLIQSEVTVSDNILKDSVVGGT